MMASVYFSSQLNSAFFTTCCRVAICDDQERCPCCKEIVEPRSHAGRWQQASGKQNAAKRDADKGE